jgi:hypothetical protein
MPRPWQYPRWRRVLLQAILWLVLAGAVGLAALVARQRVQSQQIYLSNRITINSLTLQLPAHWIISPDGDNQGVIAHEPQDSDQQRGLMIRFYPANSATSADQFLDLNGLSQESIVPPDDGTDGQIPPLPQGSEPIEIAGSQGVLRRILRSNPTMSQDDVNIREELIAAAILPTHQAIVIRLYCPPDADEDNTALIRRLAASIKS